MEPRILSAHRPVSLVLATLIALGSSLGPAAGPAAAFPSYDSGYHTYEELTSAIRDIEAAHPGLVKVSSIGKSHEGRDLWVAKVSDNVATDEDEPEVLIDGGHHGREHLSVEMALAVLKHLTSTYASSESTRRRVNGTETWILFNLNPDGTTFDGGGSTYRDWRKNRQPNGGTSAIGTDLNRNYGWKWGCCGGSSGSPPSENYRGPRPWSSPEVAALKRFVDGRVIGGRQQIRIHLSFHSFGRVVVWPWAHTGAGVPDADDRAALAAIGNEMARLAGYRGMQSHALYPTDGDQIDWMYGGHRIFSYTVELADRRYPPDEMIATETARAMPAVQYALDYASCPWSAIGRGSVHCPPSWVKRLAGSDRYATAAAISRASFTPGVPVAYVATGTNYPDALAGGAAAARDGAPVLLTQQGSLPSATATELARLKPGRIVVLGGPSVVSEAVRSKLTGYTGGGVSRLYGADRYATAAAISAAGTPRGISVVYVATGTNYPDALAAIPLAARTDSPLLLTQPHSLPYATARELDRIRPGRIVVLGGSAVVSDKVLDRMRVYTAGAVTRIAGEDRYETAAAVAVPFPAGLEATFLATGTAFPDALAGGPAAAKHGVPLLLVTPSSLPPATAGQLRRIKPASLVVLGGLGVVSDEVAAAAARAAR
ncbi:MAG: cell wall-binding repeat-containing protein [Chloroflexi bacterium]|nr:cell wall-binding repeat-containing protein [Chloroflexota bacterium]